jgi:AcrR family transcriptional regulator
MFTDLCSTKKRETDVDQHPLSERQREIVEAAMRLIAEKGGRRFTVQLLATELGVTGGAIYRHFESMEAVVDAVVDQMGAILFEGFPPRALDPLERLRLFFELRHRAIRANPHISRLLLSDHLEQASGPAHARRLEDFKRRSRRFVLDCLEEAAENGALADGLSPKTAAVIVIGSLHSLSHTGARAGADGHADVLAAEVWSALERLLRGASARDTLPMAERTMAREQRDKH